MSNSTSAAPGTQPPGGSTPQNYVVAPYLKLWPIFEADGHGAASKSRVGLTGTLTLEVQFLDDNKILRDAVMNVLRKSKGPKPLDQTNNTNTWADFANVDFRLVEHAGDVRVHFTDHSRTLVGTDALDPKLKMEEPTMELELNSELKQGQKLSKADRATILHEFGHVLGLRHEHQSPKRKGKLTFDKDAVYEAYKSGGRKVAKSQILKTYKPSDIEIFSPFDWDSIMMYPFSAEVLKEGRAIPQNFQLSRVDQAIVTLMYPPDLRDGKNVARLLKAMEIASMADQEAGIIIKAFTDHNYESGESVDIREGLEEIRKTFMSLRRAVLRRGKANAVLLSQINLDIPQSGISDFFRNLPGNKFMKNVVKNVVKEVLQQNGIDIIEPQVSETNRMQATGRLVTHPEMQQAVSTAFFELLGDRTSQVFRDAKREDEKLAEGQDEYDKHKLN